MKTPEKAAWINLGDIGYVLGNKSLIALTPIILTCATLWLVWSMHSSWLISAIDSHPALSSITSILGCLVLTMLFAGVMMPIYGWVILRRIENQYGPKTKVHVWSFMLEVKGSGLVDLNVPAAALKLGETLAKTGRA